jgi:transposase
MTRADPLEEPCARKLACTVLQTSGGSDPFAEFNRALRPVVLWRKSSFGTQSRAGSDFVERMLTVVSTLRQQQRHVLTYVTAACQTALHGQPPPSLFPTSESAPSVNLEKAA